MEITTCCVCGVQFGMPAYLDKKLRETHKSFYCPNGHSQSYTGKSEAEKRAERAERDLRWERGRREQAERDVKCAQRKVKKLTKEKEHAQSRAAHGACPCCHRNFKQLRRHMKAKHPEFVEEADKKRCPSGKRKRQS
jgi:hypothetical protein